MSDTLDKIVSLCKRRGFIFQSSEIYGGFGGAYDYGPLGVELKRNVQDSWWQAMVYGNDDIEGLDAAILMHPTVWKASGHVDAFNDPLIDDKACGRRYRADQLIEEHVERLRSKGKTDEAERVHQRLVEALHADDMNQALYEVIMDGRSAVRTPAPSTGPRCASST
jgi:glycyl-tRNA synthetase